MSLLRGTLIGTPISLALWAGIVAVAVAVSGCTAPPATEAPVIQYRDASCVCEYQAVTP